MRERTTDRVAVFYSNRGLVLYDWKALRDKSDCKRIAIVGDQQLTRIPEAIEPLFDEIHRIPEDGSKGILPQLALDPARDVLRSIVAAHPGARIRLLCADEGNTLEAAKLRDEFGLGGPGYAEILPFRDKVLMKQRVEQAGLRVPGHGSLDRDRFARDRSGYVDDMIREVSLPMVLKPLDSAGSDGVHIVENRQQLFELELRLADIDYEYEEFIDGALYHCDAVVHGGQRLFAECSLYSCGNFDFQRGLLLGSLPLDREHPHRAILLDFSEKALRALGMPDGATHMEVFMDRRGEPVFLEVAARAPGLLIVPLYERQYGVNIANMEFDIQMGLEPSAARPTSAHHFYSLIPSCEGKVVHLREPEIDSSYELTWKIAPGDSLKSCTSNLDQVGSMFVSNQSYERLCSDFESLTSQSLIVCE
jgi:biotin carboxylase